MIRGDTVKIYFNGKYISDQEAKLYYNDRGFLLGDGIFETMRVYKGSVFCLKDHYKRFKNSANYLDIPLPYTLDEFEQIINNLLKENDLYERDAALRVTLTRGAGPRGLISPEKVNPTLMATAFPLSPTIVNPSKVIISYIRRNEFSPLSRIKSLCYLDNVLAKNDAIKKHADDCILLNTHGNVACGSVANIFIVTKKGIITPRIDDGVLPGITRKVIFEICKENNMPIFEESFTIDALMKAEEVFLTNRLIEIQPIIQIEDKLISEGKIGKVFALLQKLYQNKSKNFFEKNMKI